MGRRKSEGGGEACLCFRRNLMEEGTWKEYSWRREEAGGSYGRRAACSCCSEAPHTRNALMGGGQEGEVPLGV